MKKLCIILLAAILLLLAACTPPDDYTPPPAQTTKQDKSYESRYNSSRPIADTWQGEDDYLVVSLDVLRMEDEFISHVDISADDTLVGVVAFGRSLPCEVVDGTRVFTLKPNATEAVTLNGGTGFMAQLYFKSDTVPPVCVRRVFNTHNTTTTGVPYSNMEPQKLLTLRQIKDLDLLPTIDALPDALPFAGEVRYFPRLYI